MMLSPYEVRLHLRIDDDAEDDFSMYVEAAEDHVQQHMGRAVFSTESEAQAAPAETSRPVRARGLKLRQQRRLHRRSARRAPCGRVD